MTYAKWYKDSDCDLCKMVQKEVIENPPNVDVTICHVKHDDTKQKVKDLRISNYPCLILEDLDKDMEITRFYGYTSTEIINAIIKTYESKLVV